MSEDSRSNRWMNTSAEHRGRHAVANVVETYLLRQPRAARDPFERFAVGVWIEHSPIASLADEIQVLPPGTEGQTALYLLRVMKSQSLDGEGR